MEKSATATDQTVLLWMEIMVTKEGHGAPKAVGAAGPVHSCLRSEIMSGGGVNYLRGAQMAD